MENLEKVGSSIRFAAIAVSGDPGMIHDMNTIQVKCKWKHKWYSDFQANPKTKRDPHC